MVIHQLKQAVQHVIKQALQGLQIAINVRTLLLLVIQQHVQIAHQDIYMNLLQILAILHAQLITHQMLLNAYLV